MKPTFHRYFIKAYIKLPKNIQLKVKACLRLFEKNPFSKEFNNHSLQGRYKNHRSINITGDYRAIYQPIDETMVMFVVLGGPLSTLWIKPNSGRHGNEIKNVL